MATTTVDRSSRLLFLLPLALLLCLLGLLPTTSTAFLLLPTSSSPLSSSHSHRRPLPLVVATAAADGGGDGGVHKIGEVLPEREPTLKVTRCVRLPVGVFWACACVLWCALRLSVSGIIRSRG